jgi:3',5'-cyclic AMP phosphodiesterase CpdA
MSPTHVLGKDMWTSVVRYAEKTRPDLVIHTGDVVYEDPDSDTDYEFAAFQMRRLTTQWRMVPGNHDVGDTEPDPYKGLVTPERLERYRLHFGSDRWSIDIGGWQLIGLNSQLLDNHLTEEEDEQWAWLNDQIGRSAGRPVGLFMHKPPSINTLSEDLFVNKAIGLRARSRLLELVEANAVKLIGFGHLHEHVVLFSKGALLVGAPAIGAVPRGEAVWQLGLRCNGVVEYRLSGDTVRMRLLREQDLGMAR